MKKMLTIIDIAAQAGVSKTTVSRVINNDPTVTEKNRIKVQKVLDDTNFIASENARALRSSQSRTIGFITPFQMTSFFRNEFFREIFMGMRESFAGEDYDLLIASGKGNEDDAIRRFIYKNRVEGIMLLYSIPDDPNIHVLEDRGLPYVLIGPYCNEEGKNIVEFDGRQIMREVIGYYRGRGFSDIAFFSADKEFSGNIKLLEGFRMALALSGADPDKAIVRQGLNTEELIASAFSDIVASGHIPEVIIAADETIVRTLLSVMRDMDVDRTEIFAIEDSWINSYLGISSLDLDYRTVGKTAAGLMLDTIKDPARKQKVMLPYKIEIRERRRVK